MRITKTALVLGVISIFVSMSMCLNFGYDPKAVEWYNKGWDLQDSGKYLEAIECYDKALEIEPDFVEAWNNKGLALYELGRYSEAIKCYDKALEIDPNFAVAWYNKGLALKAIGKYQEARKCFEKAYELDPRLKHK
ncbi:tetratricopeptide repeat protein [Methanotorris igneus]|uniref:Tetratricopeptide TPR_1 repeat-containing protein n=1 Tax=Methanotorris igneus (strain DSM 5666 / JCM 11834 / Kol 5) TaxID=880724 RepID=F6BEV6_METIK|nr:tetratricopeptide repeat protein [Methanotorris igneus]AEF95692.1 Tetratricopeptide TPR_1 repeat-containing protein [Methanotorris igneus Kol 5]